VIGFADVGGKLGLQFLNNPPIPFEDNGHALRIAFHDTSIGPLALPLDQFDQCQGAPDTLRFSEAGNTHTFLRLPEAPELTVAGASLVGRYRSADLDADVTVRFDGTALTLQIAGPHATTVLALDVFAADVFGWALQDPLLPLRGVLHLERADGQVQAIVLDTARTRHLRFERHTDSPTLTGKHP
jgi:hypothetical protein